MLGLHYTSTFKKDYKKAKKRGQDLQKLLAVIELLMNETPLPDVYKDHSLRGNFAGLRDCHIEPDWILLYAVEKGQLVLYRTGTHSELFKK